MDQFFKLSIWGDGLKKCSVRALLAGGHWEEIMEEGGTSRKLAEEVDQAVRQEREACARLLEAPFDDIGIGNQAVDGLRDVMLNAAAAIRARSGSTSQSG